MKNLRYALLGAVLLFISSGSVAFANVSVSPSAPTDPQPFTFFCGPYSEPFVSGNYYMPTEDGTCTYTLPTSGQEVELAIYEGTPGNATLIDSYFGYSGAATNVQVTPEDFNPPLIQGQPYFAAEYVVGVNGHSPTDDLINTNNYLLSGGTLPNGVIVNMLPFFYGVKPTTSPLTVTANNVNMVYGAQVPALSASLSGFVSGDTAANSTTGSPSCTTTATNSSPVGTYPITCTIGSLSSTNYAFNTFVDGTLTVYYRWDGFLQPINDTAHQVGLSTSVFKGGSTVPVKFQIKKADGTVVQTTTAPIWSTPQLLGPMNSSIDGSVYSDLASSGNMFNWDGSQYQYNWSTKGFAAGNWYRISAQLDDGTVQSVVIGLR